MSFPSVILRRLSNQVDDFLARWTANMDDAGYLESTTAKREDCILSYRWFLEPLLNAAEKRQTHSFGELITNTGNWAEKIIQTSRRHRSRGVTGEMFIGCFKTLVHAVLEMVNVGDEPLKQKAEAVQFIRFWADALETIIIRDWSALSHQEATDSLDCANRRLTMEKCKYENVIDSISDLVLMIDHKGLVLEVNRSARLYFKEDPTGIPILTLLRLKGHTLKNILADDTLNKPLAISLGGKLFFHCIFVPIKKISLASDEYLVILRDVTAHVKQSEALETLVAERTSELLNKKNQLQEMNITLRTVMKSVEEDREAFQERVGNKIRSTLLPALDPVRRGESKSIRNSYLDIIEDQLLKLVQGGEHDSRALLLKMTPMEMKVCRFIQAGVSTKEIAEALNLSTVTIQTHRQNIRRKLDLQNRNVNLCTFLAQIRSG